MQHLVGAVVGSFLENILPWPGVPPLLLGGRTSCRALVKPRAEPVELRAELRAELCAELYIEVYVKLYTELYIKLCAELYAEPLCVKKKFTSI